jgi:outer membrane protein assembly factor BamB
MVSGCATTPEPPLVVASKVFFPEPPGLPRIQYLRSFSSGKDIESPRSQFERFVTGEEQRIKRLDKPYGVGIYDGKIYVCDSNSTVLVFDLNSKKFQELQGAKGLGKLIQPLNIGIDSDGTKYVADPVRGQVLVYNREDFFVKAIGSPAEWTPIDVVPFDNRLYVVDKKSREIWVLKKETGELMDKIGRKGEDQTKWLGLPTNLNFDSKGYLYISDTGRFQVVKYDRDGHFIGTIGMLGTSPGRFSRPRGVSADRDGRIYVVDAAFDNVQIFNNDGRLLMFFGRPGNREGDLFLPAKVVIDYNHMEYFSEYLDPNFQAEGLVIVTSQFGPRLVNIFALGKQKGVKYPSDDALAQELEEMKKKIEVREEKKEE